MMLCFSCYSLYTNKDLTECPNILCKGYVADIDENMLAIIIELNKKGYPTEWCCAEHVYYHRPDRPTIYIRFAKRMAPKDIPEGFSTYDTKQHTVLETKMPNPIHIPALDKQLWINNNINILIEWVKALPDKTKKIRKELHNAQETEEVDRQ